MRQRIDIATREILKDNNTKAEIEIKHDMVSIRLSGHSNLSFLKSTFSRLLEICILKDQFKVLIDSSDLIGEISSIEKYDYYHHIASIYHKYLQHNGIPTRFAQLVNTEYQLSNFGYDDTLAKQFGVRMELFSNRENALEWLRS